MNYRFLLSSVLAVSFLSIAAFGFMLMNHADGQLHHGCIAAASQGVDCPRETNLLDFLAFHLVSFKNFASPAILDFSAVSLVLILSLLAIGLGISWQNIFFLPQLSRIRNFVLTVDREVSAQLDLYRWLARHENSPSF